MERIELPSTQRVADLAELSARMDAPQVNSKLAIVAVDPRAFGLARMFQIYRELNERSNKQVAVFHRLDDALAWLGIEEPGDVAATRRRSVSIR